MHGCRFVGLNLWVAPDVDVQRSTSWIWPLPVVFFRILISAWTKTTRFTSEVCCLSSFAQGKVLVFKTFKLMLKECFWTALGHGAKGDNEYKFSLEFLEPVRPEVLIFLQLLLCVLSISFSLSWMWAHDWLWELNTINPKTLRSQKPVFYSHSNIKNYFYLVCRRWSLQENRTALQSEREWNVFRTLSFNDELQEFNIIQYLRNRTSREVWKKLMFAAWIPIIKFYLNPPIG